MHSEQEEQELPESLKPVEEVNLTFLSKARALNERARTKLPEEIKSKLTPMRLVGEGLGKTALGLSVDVVEGATLASLTFGLSELIPLTELAADFGTAKLAEVLTQRPIRSESKKWGYILSWIPLIGDFASPTLFDGLTDIYIGSRALAQSMGSNTEQLSLNSKLSDK